ncbi:putative entry exclusion protein TrbK-alt [Caulobacter endophyticus]|uniref:Conjugative transfer region protein TrbK n=1 Tax=Caulobacter endophyticus TaxID=2172652 RepID=A0A2T9K9R2_9CAUL|nr:putative entry exclusion protein TrbK-alt [Caulobacter endophyticus]PVM92704.1 hypothetical protein DDF67_04865 [Caulobacter endophyticus]
MTRALVWGTALIILLGVAVLAGGASQPSSDHRSVAETPDPQLARCQTLGEASGDDPQCRAAWASARKRFFGGAAS